MKSPKNALSTKIKKLAISRSDAIGDVILTIPLAGYLKEEFPETEIIFIARAYTKAILEKSKSIDRVVLDTDFAEYLKSDKPDAIIMVFPDKRISELAKKYKVKYRIGTSHRWWHWLHCNLRVDFTRKRSEKHEAQLNFELLKGIGIDFEPKMEDLPKWFGFTRNESLNKGKVKLIFHPKSRGSARDWPLANYKKLASLLPEEQFEMHITGTDAESEIILNEDPEFFSNGRFVNHMGKFSLGELFDFINESHGIVACSTGPLHIASALGKYALGLYPPIRPMHPGRWAPLGENAHTLTGKTSCDSCPKPAECACMLAITPEKVAERIISHFNSRDLPR